ncbi:MAG: GDYXXLXY domain-containing protein [Bacteroidota bacterium]
MTRKQVYFAGFILMVLVQWAIPLQTVWKSQGTINEGKVFKFRTVPVDPNDPFRGKYMTLQFQDRKYAYGSSSGVTWVSRQTAYVIPIEDAEGYAAIDTLYAQRPTHTDTYFKATVGAISGSDSTLVIELYFPFDRFYMEEERAPIAEAHYLEQMRIPESAAYAEVAIKQGRAVLQDVIVNETSLLDLMK